MDLIGALAQAIALQEGFYKAGSRAQRNNNPGNLRPYRADQAADSAGYRVFSTLEEGWSALQGQIRANINRGLNLFEFFGGKKDENGKIVYSGYAPSADSNDPDRYARFVASKTGIDPSKPLSELSTLPASSSPASTQTAATVATQTGNPLRQVEDTLRKIPPEVTLGILAFALIATATNGRG